jgi:hypothetical protein
MRNQNGFAAIESLGTLAFAVVALTAGGLISYSAFAHQWLKHAAYETSICLSTRAPASICETSLRQTTRQALPIGQLESVSLTRTRASVKTRLRWRLSGEVVLAIDDARALPLLGRRAP